MAQYSWQTAPEPVRDQVNTLLKRFHTILGEDLTGVYLHGSLALGCFNPDRSDIDLVVVTEQALDAETQRRLAELLLSVSGRPCSIEISFLNRRDIAVWKHPLPFILHYSEDWRQQYRRELDNGDWQSWDDRQQTDADLAAHLMISHRRGISLYGPPAADLLPEVPVEDYLDAIISDYHWARVIERLSENTTYYILNACRVYAYLKTGRILSKDEGAFWALQILPDEYHSLIAQALDTYRNSNINAEYDRQALDRFVAYMNERIAI